jgi:hypothetical protein
MKNLLDNSVLRESKNIKKSDSEKREGGCISKLN